MKPLNPNSMIQGRYLIVQPIGKGGMGEVYLAVDQRLGSAVALKRTFFSEDSTLGAAFEREARILARLRHPVLPKVIDHFAENGDQYLVMEHISGDDIAKRMEAANKPFPVSWVMFWSDQMLDALAYLHSHEPPIVHRDIKPQNLKLTDDNHIVLLDFGLSKDFDSKSSGLNSASVAGYSPHFASMEQIRGTGTDARSDLYSLAATLYQMLTNTIPVDALTRADAILGGNTDPIKALDEINPEVNPAISDVILKAVSIRQDERYSTALEMQKALRRAYNAEKPEKTSKPSVRPEAVSATPTQQTSQPRDAVVTNEVSEHPEMETQIRVDAPIPLDATLHMPSMADEPAKQSEMKTEVLNNDELAQAASANQTKETTESASQPLAAAATASAVPAPTPVRPLASSAPAAGSKATPKNGSKAGLIVGVLLGLLLIVGVGGGAGWWLLTRDTSTSTGAPTPSTANVPVSSPSPEAPLLTNSNTQSSSNTETDVSGDPGLASANSNVAGSSNSTNSRSSTTSPSAPTTKANSSRPPAVPADKGTPKAKPKDDRTVILQ